MRKRKLGRTGLEVSEIGFGALEIGRAWGVPIEGDFAVPTEKEVQGLLDRALELGINLIDTAPAYMLSEERIGRLLSHRRNEFYLGSKCGEYFDGYDSRYDFSRTGTLRFIDTSLKRLQTDHLDLIQIHCGPDEIDTIRRGETLDGMLRAKKEGKVRWVGASCNATGARAALESGGYDVLQLPYSLVSREIEGEILSRAASAGVGIIIREPLERGKLTAKIHAMPESDPTAARIKTIAAGLKARGVTTPLSRLAIAFVLRRPEVATVIVGTRKIPHLEEAVAAAGEPFNPGLLSSL